MHVQLVKDLQKELQLLKSHISKLDKASVEKSRYFTVKISALLLIELMLRHWIRSTTSVLCRHCFVL